jgi:anti-anti-sigma factor
MSHAIAAGLLAPQVVVTTNWAATLEVTAIHTEAARATVQVEGEVNATNAGLLSAVLENQLSQGHRYVRLDLSCVGCLDRAGLRALVVAHNNFLAAGGTLVLIGVTAQIVGLLRATHLDEALLVADGPFSAPRKAAPAGRCST